MLFPKCKYCVTRMYVGISPPLKNIGIIKNMTRGFLYVNCGELNRYPKDAESYTINVEPVNAEKRVTSIDFTSPADSENTAL